MNVILELKYNDNGDRRATQVASKFPYFKTKSSKYVSGLSCFKLVIKHMEYSGS